MNCQEPLIESDMTFGPFPAGHCFPIETCDTYRKLGDGVKIAEFLLLKTTEGKPPVIWIVEAKKSSPKPQTQPAFDQYVADIQAKLSNALGLWFAMRLNRHSEDATELPEQFRQLDLAVVDFRLILVIKGFEMAWLDPLRDALKKKLRPLVKTWALSPMAVQVINDEMARTHNLIQ